MFTLLIARLLRRPPPTGVINLGPARVTDSLVLRQLNTYQFVVAPPRKRISPPILDAERVEGGQVIPEDQAEEITVHRRNSQSHLFRSSDDPFSDAHTPDNAGISTPPSAFVRSRLTLSDADGSLHWDSASSVYSNPFTEPNASAETASIPASARAPSFIGSTASSGHALALTESTPPTPRSEADDFGYLSDATMSTLPPSYRTNRANTPRVPHLPLPAQTSAYDTITAPPSAFTTRNLRRSIMHGPRPPSSARQEGAGVDQASAIGDVVVDDGPSGSGGPSRRARYGGRQHPRKSVDGGVRLEGGPLDSGGESSTVIDGAAESELDPPPVYKGPRRDLGEKGELRLND
ncbi:uncharacterized protein TRAVEDRAFT_53996 [Trametes versicolor FP-101664 SS1]|uniref:Uncharacterized protein n=1 Tax=Trametes versicolor (strain FP-101664) TaxID=717944 RepID=R7SAM9_TRAVS|nr:uncharacterized protein TRAVEDRAFT_53996 [Trametes versicolor FP-101664 SS1]EIW52014.1 hypothetical protein TRAVEDRAFT_53996 [Trametes versicolor FP-101664 SS1]